MRVACGDRKFHRCILSGRRKRHPDIDSNRAKETTLETYQPSPRRGEEVARRPTAHAKRDYRCYLPVLAGFARPTSHRTWPTGNLTRCEQVSIENFADAILVLFRKRF